MGFYRTPSKKSKYYLPKEEYLTAIHYALRYPYLLEELQTLNADTSQAIRYDKDRVQTSNQYDATAEIGIQRAEVRGKIEKIEDALNKAARTQNERKFLRLGVCYGDNFWNLERKGIKCGKARYYTMRRVFYYILAQKI